MPNIQFQFQGYHVVITGGASGIGQATALVFAGAGAQVAVIDRDPATETEAKASNLSGTVKGYQADLAKAQDVAAAADAILKDFDGRVDILFCNAGVGQALDTRGSCEKPPDEEWIRLYDINTVGVIRTTRAFLPAMKARQFGKIVITASTAAYRPDPVKAVYCVTKLASIQYALCLAKELGEDNINVNVLNPSLVYTHIYSTGTALALRELYPDRFQGCNTGEEVLQRMTEGSSAFKRIQRPEDCANMVAFLCTEEAKEITGQIFNVDSGTVMKL